MEKRLSERKGISGKEQQLPQKQSVYLRFSHQVARLFAVPLIHQTQMQVGGKRLQVMQLIEDVVQSTAASVFWQPPGQRKVEMDLDRHMENNQHSWLRALLY